MRIYSPLSDIRISIRVWPQHLTTVSARQCQLAYSESIVSRSESYLSDTQGCMRVGDPSYAVSFPSSQTTVRSIWTATLRRLQYFLTPLAFGHASLALLSGNATGCLGSGRRLPFKISNEVRNAVFLHDGSESAAARLNHPEREGSVPCACSSIERGDHALRVLGRARAEV